jgi:hypothetical protein
MKLAGHFAYIIYIYIRVYIVSQSLSQKLIHYTRSYFPRSWWVLISPFKFHGGKFNSFNYFSSIFNCPSHHHSLPPSLLIPYQVKISPTLPFLHIINHFLLTSPFVSSHVFLSHPIYMYILSSFFTLI